MAEGLNIGSLDPIALAWSEASATRRAARRDAVRFAVAGTLMWVASVVLGVEVARALCLLGFVGGWCLGGAINAHRRARMADRNYAVARDRWYARGRRVGVT